MNKMKMQNGLVQSGRDQEIAGTRLASLIPRWRRSRSRFLVMWVGIVCLLSITIAHADLTMIQEVEKFQNEKPFQKEQLKVAVSGKRLRMDVGQVMTSIILGDKKATYSISHEARQYVILPHAEAAQKEPAAAVGSDRPWENATVEPTGQTEQVSGFTCRQVVIREKTGIVTELWLSDEAMKIDKYFSEFQNFNEFGTNPILDELQKRPDLHGFPIRVVQYENDQIKYRSTVRRLDNNKVPDSEFEIPSGYEEVKPVAPIVSPSTPPPK